VSLQRNIVANYASQLYVTAIGIATLPLYVKYMGAETYGLVGFFAMMQAWFALLDVGLTPTMSRETARFRGGAIDALSYRRFVRALEGIFLAVALAGGGLMFAGAGVIGRRWLVVKELTLSEVTLSLQLMAVIIALRWMGGLYRGAVSGSERLVWLGACSAVIASLRFLGVLPILRFWGGTPAHFFFFQLAVAILEMGLLFGKAQSLLPPVAAGDRAPWSFAPRKPVLKFSLTIAFTSSAWVLITQTDKLVLSKILPLDQYGYFTLAVLVASGVMVISGPISGALMPRMARLEAEGEHKALILLYRRSTQFVAVVCAAACMTLAFRAEPLLIAWTGNTDLAHQAAPILRLYGLGNGVLAVSAFPYYLQYAKGNLRLHLMGNVVFVLVLIPAIILASQHYGARGAGYVWLGINLLSFVAWLPLVHARFEPGLNLKWYTEDTLFIFSAAGLGGFAAQAWIPQGQGRLAVGAFSVVFGLAVTLAGAAAASMTWRAVHSLLDRAAKTEEPA
jgi:O-antigen/teichoic acid export membrane protein